MASAITRHFPSPLLPQVHIYINYISFELLHTVLPNIIVGKTIMFLETCPLKHVIFSFQYSSKRQNYSLVENPGAALCLMELGKRKMSLSSDWQPKIIQMRDFTSDPQNNLNSSEQRQFFTRT